MLDKPLVLLFNRQVGSTESTAEPAVEDTRDEDCTLSSCMNAITDIYVSIHPVLPTVFCYIYIYINNYMQEALEVDYDDEPCIVSVTIVEPTAQALSSTVKEEVSDESSATLVLQNRIVVLRNGMDMCTLYPIDFAPFISYFSRNSPS